MKKKQTRNSRPKPYDPPKWICHFAPACEKAKYCYHGETHYYCDGKAVRCFDHGPGGIMAWCDPMERPAAAAGMDE